MDKLEKDLKKLQFRFWKTCMAEQFFGFFVAADAFDTTLRGHICL